MSSPLGKKYRPGGECRRMALLRARVIQGSYSGEHRQELHKEPDDLALYTFFQDSLLSRYSYLSHFQFSDFRIFCIRINRFRPITVDYKFPIHGARFQKILYIHYISIIDQG
jgi:hypothetical protein